MVEAIIPYLLIPMMVYVMVGYALLEINNSAFSKIYKKYRYIYASAEMDNELRSVRYRHREVLIYFIIHTCVMYLFSTTYRGVVSDFLIMGTEGLTSLICAVFMNLLLNNYTDQNSRGRASFKWVVDRVRDEYYGGEEQPFLYQFFPRTDVLDSRLEEHIRIRNPASKEEKVALAREFIYNAHPKIVKMIREQSHYEEWTSSHQPDEWHLYRRPNGKARKDNHLVKPRLSTGAP